MLSQRMSRGGGIKRLTDQVTISLIYYRFIVRFTIGFEFLFTIFLLQFFLAQVSSLSMSSSAIYYSTLSNHIYLSVDIISVYLNDVMHQVLY